jgi:DNA-binding response OmpR family regulator
MNETLTKRLILIADDDADTRSIVASAVQMLGAQTVEAADGQQALKLYNQLEIDLVILDVMMPLINGNQVCTEIKASVMGPYVPVLMLTARDSIKDKVDALEGGADDYLTKPFHYQELQARIKALLRVRELNLQLRASNEQLTLMQEKVISQERQLVLTQLAGTAAHQLGQPLSAIMLNCHLLETLPPEDERTKRALQAIKSDAKRMAELIQKLRSADASKKEAYHGNSEIIEIDAGKKSM